MRTKERCNVACPDSKPLLRCKLKKGHFGEHANSATGWGNQPPAAAPAPAASGPDAAQVALGQARDILKDQDYRPADLVDKFLDAQGIIQNLCAALEAARRDTVAWVEKYMTQSTELRELERQPAEARWVLGMVEWSGTFAEENGFCPLCDQHESKGHSPDCPLGAALGSPSTEGPEAGIEVRLNGDDTLDEVVANNVSFHLEQMDDTGWWMGITKGQQSVMVKLFTQGKRPRPVLATWDDESEGEAVTVTGGKPEAGNV